MDFAVIKLKDQAQHAKLTVSQLTAYSKRMCEALYRLCKQEEWRLKDFSNCGGLHSVLELHYKMIHYLWQYHCNLRRVYASHLKALNEAEPDIFRQANKQVSGLKQLNKAARRIDTPDSSLSLYQKNGERLEESLLTLLRRVLGSLSQHLPSASRGLPPELDYEVGAFSQRVLPALLPPEKVPDSPPLPDFSVRRL